MWASACPWGQPGPDWGAPREPEGPACGRPASCSRTSSEAAGDLVRSRRVTIGKLVGSESAGRVGGCGGRATWGHLVAVVFVQHMHVGEKSFTACLLQFHP